MFGIETLQGSGRAVAEVGFVLAEALVLYVAYGGLSAAVGDQLIEAVQGT